MSQELPLAEDVSLDRLSDTDFVGGEIKNVVLNASRRTLRRSREGPVTVRDFQQAIEMEQEEKWSGESSPCMGF